MKRRFLCLETDDGSILFGAIERILNAQLHKAEMAMEKLTDPEKAQELVLASPEDYWFILTCYDVPGDTYPRSFIANVRRVEPTINAYIVLLSGEGRVSEERLKGFGADTSVLKGEPLRIPLQREFDRFINFARKARRNSRTDLGPPSQT